MKLVNLKFNAIRIVKPIVILMTIATLVSFTSDNEDTKITVIVNGFKNASGNCIINIYTKSTGFPNNNKLAYKSIPVKIKNNSAQLIFENMEPGTYAVSVLHDANGNGVMDKNMFGIPSEGYGASNNIIPSFSSPKFEDSKFKITNQDKTIVIKIEY